MNYTDSENLKTVKDSFNFRVQDQIFVGAARQFASRLIRVSYFKVARWLKAGFHLRPKHKHKEHTQAQ